MKYRVKEVGSNRFAVQYRRWILPWATLPMGWGHAVYGSEGAVNAKLREENEKFRAYVRENGPCAKCYYGDKGCDRRCDSGDAWAAIREV